MDEVLKITEKYDEAFIKAGLSSVEALNKFALTFYKDVAEVYDCITRIRNIERNPKGFSLNDAPILGLLVRIWKLLKEVIRYYEENNAEIIGILERPLIEAAVVARYLMTSDQSIVEDYRKCSYKGRLRLLRNLQTGSAFYKTKAGQRLIKSVREKMDFEKLTPQDFEVQKKNRWKIQGKSFYDIFAEVEHADLYAATYGMMSESIHGSWNESMDFCLNKNDDGTFSTYSTRKTVEFNRRQREFIETNDKLNKLLLDREEQENLSQKQADISANFVKVGSGNYRLKVFNRGRSLAHNVRIGFPSGNEILIEDDVKAKFPMPTLEPQQSVELIAAVSMDSPRRMEIKLVWDDQSGENREKVITIAI